MTQILKATCVNGGLVLEQELSPLLEGKKLEIVVKAVDELTDPGFEQKFEKFLAKAQEYSFKLPPDYKFDRNEIYDR
jgi:hypothetical protein